MYPLAFLSGIPLTINDLFNAAFWAAVIVIAIRLLGWGFRLIIARTSHINFDPSRAEEVLQRCRRLFPIEQLHFDGATIKRGTFVRIVTNRQAALEGEFVGTNRNDMLCLVTNSSVIAQELQAIETIQAIGKVSG
jgi:hypothetical protein